jgi:hypothetical protein
MRMGMKMRMNINLKDSQIVVGWSVFIFIPLLILILNRLLAFARDRLLGVASENNSWTPLYFVFIFLN